VNPSVSLFRLLLSARSYVRLLAAPESFEMEMVAGSSFRTTRSPRFSDGGFFFILWDLFFSCFVGLFDFIVLIFYVRGSGPFVVFREVESLIRQFRCVLPRFY